MRPHDIYVNKFSWYFRFGFEKSKWCKKLKNAMYISHQKTGYLRLDAGVQIQWHSCNHLKSNEQWVSGHSLHIGKSIFILEYLNKTMVSINFSVLKLAKNGFKTFANSSIKCQ